MNVLCIDGSVDIINGAPVSEHTVVLEEGKRYKVVETFNLGPHLFYILEGQGRNAFHSVMFLRIHPEFEDRLEKILDALVESEMK